MKPTKPTLWPTPTPARGVWRVRLAWTQTYVLADGADFMLVDSGLRGERARLLAALEEQNLTRCRGLLLTHGHCDHAGNAAFLQQHFGAPVWAHQKEAPFLETRRTYAPRGFRGLTPQGAMFAGGEFVFPVARLGLDGYLHEGEEIETPAGNWRVLHTPGHTQGHISFWRESDGALLSGDALLNIIPFTSRNGVSIPAPLFNWNNAAVFKSARRLATLEPRVLLPGHGPPMAERTAEQIHRYIATLRF